MNVVLRLMEAAVKFVWGWGLLSHFHVQPNYSDEVVLRCVVLGVVTIESKLRIHCFDFGKKLRHLLCVEPQQSDFIFLFGLGSS